MAEIGKRIRSRREELGMTQEELASKLGYKNKSTIAKIENGTNDIVQSKVKAFAHALSTSVSYLMGWDSSEDDSTSDQQADESYYIDEKAREIAEFMHKNPDYSALFDASRKVKPENLEIVKQIIEKFSDGN